MQQHYIATIEKRRLSGANLAYGLDMRTAQGFDGVQMITRAPMIFEYLYSHFALAADEERADGHYVLHMRPQLRDARVEEILFTTRRQTPSFGVLELRTPSTCGLVRLEMRTSYTQNPYLHRPSGIDLSFGGGDKPIWEGSIRPAELKTAFHTYISVAAPLAFYKVFGNGVSSDQKWNRLEYHASPTDWLGSQPSLIEVAHVQCVDPQTDIPAPWCP